MGSDNTLGFVSQVEGCGLCLGNGNISAAYLCPAAGGGMQHWRWFCVWIPEHSQTFLPKEVEERHRSFFLKSSCLEMSLNQDTATISYLLFIFYLQSVILMSGGLTRSGSALGEYCSWHRTAALLPPEPHRGLSPRMFVTQALHHREAGWAVASVLLELSLFLFSFVVLFNSKGLGKLKFGLLFRE